MDRVPVNILLVDDQPAKLIAYEVILKQLGENLIVASSGREALEHLLKTEIAVILIDVCMPELDGFELAAMIREHPRFQKIAIIFVSAIQVTDLDSLRGYEMGAVDYLPVPVVPEVLRAKVKVFVELFRKGRELEALNVELEARVRERTAELEASNRLLLESETRRSLAIAAGNMGSWDWDCVNGDWMWDRGQYLICGVDPDQFIVTSASIRALILAEDLDRLRGLLDQAAGEARTINIELRIRRPNGDMRWCSVTAASSVDSEGRQIRLSGVTIDITERKNAEQRQSLLSREVDHRAKNALAVVQSMVRLTRAPDMESYLTAIEGRISALARVHTILSLSSWESAELSVLTRSEIEPYGQPGQIAFSGRPLLLEPAAAQIVAMVLHELATNAAKYGALSDTIGRLSVSWHTDADGLHVTWNETGGPAVSAPTQRGFGTRSVIGSVETQLGGKAEFDWDPAGLKCRLHVPLNPSAAEEPQPRRLKRRA